MRELREILDNTDSVQVRWSNQRKLPYDEWVEVEVSLNNESQNPVTVLFLEQMPLNTYQHHPKQMTCNISGQDAYQTIHQKFLIHSSLTTISKGI